MLHLYAVLLQGAALQAVPFAGLEPRLRRLSDGDRGGRRDVRSRGYLVADRGEVGVGGLLVLERRLPADAVLVEVVDDPGGLRSTTRGPGPLPNFCHRFPSSDNG